MWGRADVIDCKLEIHKIEWANQETQVGKRVLIEFLYKSTFIAQRISFLFFDKYLGLGPVTDVDCESC